jgi:hypothetical protein
MMKTCGLCGRKLYPRNETGFCQSTSACRQSHLAVKNGRTRCLGCGRWLKKSADLGYCSLTIGCKNAKATLRRQRIKQIVVDAYGGKCACCGETRLYFLTIDHVDGGGTKERLSTKRTSSTTMHYYLRRAGYPQGYQVLCFNCNCAKSDDEFCPCYLERA